MRRLFVSSLPALCAALLSSTAVNAAPFEKSGIADWTTPPPTTAEPVFVPPVAKRMKLENGMSVLVVENHSLPVVAMYLVVPGAGSTADPAGKGGLAAFTADMIDEGAGGLSALDIAEQQDRLGAAIRFVIDSDAATASVRTLTKTLDPTIDLLAKILTQPAFAGADLERVKGDRLTSLDQRRDRPREVASIMLSGALYGMASPYGHPVNGVADELKGETTADVTAFYKEHWNPAVSTLVISGDVDPVALRAKLEAALGTWKQPGAKPPARVAATARAAKRLQLADRTGAAQSDVRIGLIGPDRKDSRYFAFEVMRTILGGGFTSRLNQRLREQLGITYGINASMDWHIQPGPFVVGSAIKTPETAKGLAEAFKIIDDLAATDVPAAELDKAKQNIIRALPAEFETNAGTSAQFAELAFFGLPDDYFASYADQIRKVTAADVKAAARGTIPSGKMVISIVGDMSKVRTGIDALKLGEAEMHDLYGVSLKP